MKKNSRAIENKGAGVGPELLPGIEKAINRALSAVAAQEEALASSGPADPAAISQPLESIRDRIFGLRVCVDGAEQIVKEFDATVRASEGEIRAFLQSAEALGQNLAEWQASAIG